MGDSNALASQICGVIDRIGVTSSEFEATSNDAGPSSTQAASRSADFASDSTKSGSDSTELGRCRSSLARMRANSHRCRLHHRSRFGRSWLNLTDVVRNSVKSQPRLVESMPTRPNPLQMRTMSPHNQLSDDWTSRNYCVILRDAVATPVTSSPSSGKHRPPSAEPACSPPSDIRMPRR